MQFREFLSLLQSKTGHSPHKTSDGYSACCPAHDDQKPSLSLSEGQDGKILLHCFAGCTTEAICTSLNIQQSHLFDKPVNPVARKKTIYPYQDETGKELYRKVRIEPGFNGQAKSFYWERTDENGSIARNLKDCRKVLYRLPELLKGISKNEPIFLVEGEKDVDNLAKYCLIATTSSESLTWTDEFTETLKNANAVILYDMDKTGLQRKNLLYEKLHTKTKRLCVVDLPGLEYQESHGSDVSDWLAMGHTTSELLEIVAQTSDNPPSKINVVIRSVTLGEFLEMKIPEPEMLLSPLFTLSRSSNDLRQARRWKNTRCSRDRLCGCTRRTLLKMGSPTTSKSSLYRWGDARHCHADPPSPHRCFHTVR